MFKKRVSSLMLALLLSFVLVSLPNFAVAKPYETENGGAADVPTSDRPLATPWGDWAHYHNYSEIVDTLLYLNSTHPN
ncbi:MAG: hypothetical protein WCC63_00390, partial [Candidatus Bathyarchaeia archaeon]